MSFQIDQVIGVSIRGDGFSAGPDRLGRLNEDIVAQGRGRYAEQTHRKQVFSMILTATTTGVAAGNIVGAAAGASTQFALPNPANSGVNLELLKFGMGVISGTPGAGPLWHGFIPNASTIIAASPGGTVRSNSLSQSVASAVTVPWASAAGAALTGGQAPITHRMADFSSTATAQASVSEQRVVEYIDGDLIVPPGTLWLPLWSAAGTALLNGYSITWAEVPI
jgi:hypothetical protein